MKSWQAHKACDSSALHLPSSIPHRYLAHYNMAPISAPRCVPDGVYRIQSFSRRDLFLQVPSGDQGVQPLPLSESNKLQEVLLAPPQPLGRWAKFLILSFLQWKITGVPGSNNKYAISSKVTSAALGYEYKASASSTFPVCKSTTQTVYWSIEPQLGGFVWEAHYLPMVSSDVFL